MLAELVQSAMGFTNTDAEFTSQMRN